MRSFDAGQSLVRHGFCLGGHSPASDLLIACQAGVNLRSRNRQTEERATLGGAEMVHNFASTNGRPVEGPIGVLYLSLANCYAGPILPVMASESELALTFGAPVAVKRSDPRNALRWENIE
jgi:hypothetical protein